MAADAIVRLEGLVKRYGLRKGDAITGQVKQPRDGDRAQKFNPLVKVDTVNGSDPEESRGRPDFGKLTPLYQQERLRLALQPLREAERAVALVQRDVVGVIAEEEHVGVVRLEGVGPGGKAYRILYVSERPDGTRAASGAMLFIPDAPAPAQGRHR